MADPARARKIADRIKVLTAEYLEHRLKDERLGFVTVTDVRVTGDLQHATLFYTVFGSDEEREATGQALKDNTWKIRSHVGKALGIRLTAPAGRWSRYAGFGALVVAVEALVWSAEWFVIGGARPSFGFGLTWLALAATFGIPAVLLSLGLRMLPRQRKLPAA